MTLVWMLLAFIAGFCICAAPGAYLLWLDHRYR